MAAAKGGKGDSGSELRLLMKETVRFKRPPIIILPAIHIIVLTMREIVHTSLHSTSNAP